MEARRTRRCPTLERSVPTIATTPAARRRGQEAGSGEAMGAAGGKRDDGPHQRYAGNQQPGQRAGDMLLRRSQEDPRDGDLDRRKATSQRQCASIARRSTRAARSAAGSPRRSPSVPGPARRVNLCHRDPDEQVRDAPDDRHQGEQDQAAATSCASYLPYLGGGGMARRRRASTSPGHTVGTRSLMTAKSGHAG